MTTRIKIALFLATLVGLWLLYKVSTSIWWTPRGYCFGAYASCFGRTV